MFRLPDQIGLDQLVIIRLSPVIPITFASVVLKWLACFGVRVEEVPGDPGAAAPDPLVLINKESINYPELSRDPKSPKGNLRLGTHEIFGRTTQRLCLVNGAGPSGHRGTVVGGRTLSVAGAGPNGPVGLFPHLKRVKPQMRISSPPYQRLRYSGP